MVLLASPQLIKTRAAQGREKCMFSEDEHLHFSQFTSEFLKDTLVQRGFCGRGKKSSTSGRNLTTVSLSVQKFDLRMGIAGINFKSFPKTWTNTCLSFFTMPFYFFIIVIIITIIIFILLGMCTL
jgi:hypothetical protein